MSDAKGKDGSGEANIYKYLRSKNRPYNVNDLVLNLRLGKGAVQKALEKLVGEGKVTEKAFGKQKIYFVTQDESLEKNPTEMVYMDGRIEIMEQQLKKMESEFRAHTSELRELTLTMTTRDAEAAFEREAPTVWAMEEKCKRFAEEKVVCDTHERNEIRLNRNESLKKWRARKRLANEMADSVLEHYVKTKREFFEEVGVETDEDVLARMPPN